MGVSLCILYYLFSISLRACTSHWKMQVTTGRHDNKVQQPFCNVNSRTWFAKDILKMSTHSNLSLYNYTWISIRKWRFLLVLNPNIATEVSSACLFIFQWVVGSDVFVGEMLGICWCEPLVLGAWHPSPVSFNSFYFNTLQPMFR